MNVGALQSFIRNTGELLFVSESKKVPPDLESICAALEPFKDQKVAKFAEFLSRVAEEYVRTGAVAIPGTGSRTGGGKGKTPKARVKTKADVEDIAAAATQLTAIYDRAIDPALRYDEIEATVEKIAKEFDKDGLIAVARSFGIKDRLASKKDAQERIRRRIADCKGSFERGPDLDDEVVVAVEASEA